ncbi:hypothetical protein QBC45DRAFT_461243 [Copromyces sp. CBS 386.78]|nr:hypothetical protein QBC45DRAFT_461243 [Copromyces sp. CBS 386.78]
MPNLKNEEGRANPPARPAPSTVIKSEESRNECPPAPRAPSSLDMEAVIEISREEFQARKKRRTEEKRSEAAKIFTPHLFIPDIRIKGEEEGSSRDMDDPLAPAPGPKPGPNIDANEHIDYWRDSLSPKQRLRFALKKILESKVNHALAITAENKTILRPLLLKPYWVKGQLVPSNLKWERHEHYTGVARYLFTPKDNEETCTKCTTTDNYGPFAECVAGDRGVHMGACFNCYCKGEGKSCSLRIAYEKAEEKARHARDGVPFSVITVRNASTRDLEKALRWIQDEIRMREED